MHKHLVLITDDDSNFREILRLKLESLGFEVVEAENGKVALDKLETINPDLIFLDFEMPVMNGIEALIKIRENEKFAKIKVIFLTNYGETHKDFKGIDDVVAHELGAVSYIKKSDDLDIIVSEVEKTVHDLRN